LRTGETVTTDTTELLLGLVAVASLVAMTVGMALWAALRISLFIAGHGSGASRGDPGPLTGSFALVGALFVHPGSPWAGYPGLANTAAPNAVMFWIVASVALVIAGALATVVVCAVRTWLYPGQNRDTHGKATWANRADVARACTLRPPGNIDPHGVVLGWWGRRKVVQSRPEDNVLVVGTTRSGKTSTVVVPTLFGWRGSVLATSTKAELVRLTGPTRRQLGGRVGVFAPLDEDHKWIADLGLNVVTWNPLTSIRSVGSAGELADVFTGEGKRTEAAHWYLAASSVLTGLFVLEAQRLQLGGAGGDLRHALHLLHTTRLEDYPALALEVDDPQAKELLSGLASTPDREAGSIVSTARVALSLWIDERVAAATAVQAESELDITAFLRDGGTLYLVAPVEEAERCRPLFSALLQAILRAASIRAQSSPRGVLEPRLLLALDEVANFVRIPRLASYVSTGPGQGVQTLLCFQDLAQLEGGYGKEDARSIMNNCRCKVLMPGQGDLGTLDAFSRSIGQATTIYTAPSWNPDGRQARSQHRVSGPLAAPDVLRCTREPVLVAGDANPAILRSRGWWQVPEWSSRIASDPQTPAH
jgi:type IV secretion system protein VirD4